eukprot:CAMPEP_0198733956 /NCGR_PEP_ID=MMETSP1475-20131203/49421_1 /TAXON_ID= ORGANISM="Unidentified sp., Strain CCMP1999" /NCGR_SAMPLE_ID=MMETSP1475 /ASSEMBLY_ACC=CAM_ASM_001111 /LENGTH=193 /DNA_ID=CAMNT_0044497341 /DNA_START=260 /DNA_END=841 /DNA_ORIENTATION=-
MASHRRSGEQLEDHRLSPDAVASDDPQIGHVESQPHMGTFCSDEETGASVDVMARGSENSDHMELQEMANRMWNLHTSQTWVSQALRDPRLEALEATNTNLKQTIRDAIQHIDNVLQTSQPLASDLSSFERTGPKNGPELSESLDPQSSFRLENIFGEAQPSNYHQQQNYCIPEDEKAELLSAKSASCGLTFG